MMTKVDSYLLKISQASIVDCKPNQSSLFQSNEQSYLLIVDVEGEHKHIEITQREKEIVLEKMQIGDEVTVFEERNAGKILYDIISNNKSLLKNNNENVRRVNSTLQSSSSVFNETEYKHMYQSFEYIYERMTEANQENTEAIYLYFKALAESKNGQKALDGSGDLIKQSIKFALAEDMSFDSLIKLFDFDNENNIKVVINESDDEMKEIFFKKLVATKTELNLSEKEIFKPFKNLSIATINS